MVGVEMRLGRLRISRPPRGERGRVSEVVKGVNDLVQFLY